MKLLAISLLILSFLHNISFADENLNKIKKIDQQLETLKSLYESGVLEQNEYENSTAKLLSKKASLLEPKKKIMTLKKEALI